MSTAVIEKPWSTWDIHPCAGCHRVFRVAQWSPDWLCEGCREPRAVSYAKRSIQPYRHQGTKRGRSR
jgi:hypothetical protein